VSDTKVMYFGYGATRDSGVISIILGKPESALVGRKAVLEGFDLAIQRLDQVPDVILPTAPSAISVRESLRKVWGDNFRSYVLKPNSGGRVSGIIWELTPEDIERIKDWELLDFGWFEDTNGEAITPEGNRIPVVTEKIRSDQEVDQVVDGLEYETWLEDPEKFKAVAEKARHEYDDRLLRGEGLLDDPERKLS